MSTVSHYFASSVQDTKIATPFVFRCDNLWPSDVIGHNRHVTTTLTRQHWEKWMRDEMKQHTAPRCNKSQVKIKIKSLHLHATKACRGSRGTAPLIPNLGNTWRFRPLHPKTWYPLNRMLGWPHRRDGRWWEEKTLLVPTGFEPLIVQSVASPL
jgi:hypothetical protein